MALDRYVCRDCRKKWKGAPERSITTHCPECYSGSIINLSAKERFEKRKQKELERKAAKKETFEEYLKIMKREAIRNRERKMRYSRARKR